MESEVSIGLQHWVAGKISQQGSKNWISVTIILG